MLTSATLLSVSNLHSERSSTCQSDARLATYADTLRNGSPSKYFGGVHAVDHVHQHTAAGELGIAPPIAGGARLVDDPEEIGDHRSNGADLAGVEHLASDHDLRQGDVVVDDPERHAVPLGGLDACRRVGGNCRQWLLAQDVLAGLGGSDQQVAPERLRCADVDDVDICRVRSGRRRRRRRRRSTGRVGAATDRARRDGDRRRRRRGRGRETRARSVRACGRRCCRIRRCPLRARPIAHGPVVVTCGPPSTMR